MLANNVNITTKTTNKRLNICSPFLKNVAPTYIIIISHTNPIKQKPKTYIILSHYIEVAAKPLKTDSMGPDSAKCACTILLSPKKIKNFYSLIHNNLPILTFSKSAIFRIIRAGSCKVWRDVFSSLKKFVISAKAGIYCLDNLNLEISILFRNSSLVLRTSCKVT
jgi:hypothetical protein